VRGGNLGIIKMWTFFFKWFTSINSDFSRIKNVFEVSHYSVGATMPAFCGPARKIKKNNIC